MFFKNHLISLASRFLWVGLILGVFYIVCEMVVKISRKNLYVTNIIGFCFWLLFGGLFARMCVVYYNYSFCWFGLFSMFVGWFLVKISINFFFTKFAWLLYNKLANSKRRKRNYEQLQTNSQT